MIRVLAIALFAIMASSVYVLGQTTIQIGTAAELAKFAEDINNGTIPANSNAELTANIDFSDYPTTMIGHTDAKAYSGTFDGKGHIITVKYDFPGGTSYNDSFGLFGFVSSPSADASKGATIQNLVVDGTMNVNGEFWHVGSIVGSDVLEDGKGSTTTITNCTSYVKITAVQQGNIGWSTLGGIIGACQNTLNMDKCGFMGNIESTSIGKDLNRNTIIGGLAGSSKSGEIKKSFVYIDDTMIVKTDNKIDSNNNSIYNILGNRESYSDGTNIGDLVYCYIKGKDINGKTDIKFKGRGQETKDGTLVDILTNTTLASPKTSTFYISNAKELKAFADIVDKGGDWRELNGTLLKDIDYSNYKNLDDMIGGKGSDKRYAGTFDGQYHNITINLATDQKYAALFRFVGTATIKNLMVDGTVKSTYNTDLGGICGYNVNNNPVTIERCISKVTLHFAGSNQPKWSGGIMNRGYSGFKLTDCAYIGKFKNESGKTMQYCGGLVGATEDVGANVKDEETNETNDYRTKGVGTYTNCYADVTYESQKGNPMSDCYIIASEGSRSTFTNCYYANDFGAPNTGVHKKEGGLENGKICYYLNDGRTGDETVWFQNTETEKYPVLKKCSCKKSEGNHVVYISGELRCPNDDGRATFTNQSGLEMSIGEHEYKDNGECKYCGQLQKTSDGYFIISNEDRLLVFAKKVKDGYVNEKAIVTKDLDLTGETFKKYYNDNKCFIGNSYQGVFDGGYNTITIDVTAQKNYSGGLFGTISAATIKNLIVKGNVNANGYTYIGGIVGRNYTRTCTLEKCMSLVDITTNISGEAHVGGLIGSCEVKNWTMNYCAFAGNIIPTNPSTTYCNGFIGNNIYKLGDAQSTQTGTIKYSFVFANAPSNTDRTQCYTFVPSIGNTINSCCYLQEYKLDNNNQEDHTANPNAKIKATADFKNSSILTLLNPSNQYPWYLYTGSTGLGYDYPTIVGYIWEGKTSTDWNEPTNWRRGIVPTNYSTQKTPGYNNVIIPGYTGQKDPHFGTGTVKLKDIEIKYGANMYVEGDATLTVDGTINRSGNLILNYGDAHVEGNVSSPNVILNGDSPSGVTVNRTIATNILYYLGSATKEMTINKGYNTSRDFHSYYSYGAFNSSRMDYAEFNGKWYTGNTLYLENTNGDKSTIFTQIGTIHNNKNEENVALISGWNWLSNIYPFTADAKDGLVPDDANVNATVYVRSNGGGNGFRFITYNTTVDEVANGNEAAKYIAPFQSYCVYSESATSTTIKAKCVADQHSKLKSGTIDNKDVVRLRVYANGSQDFDDEAVIVMRADGEEFATSNDSYKYAVSNKNQISVFKNGSNSQYTIGLYPSTYFMSGKEISVAIKPISSAKTITIKGNTEKLSSDCDVVLVDHATGNEINLREEALTIEAASITSGRFAVKVTNKNDSEGTKTNIEEASKAYTSVYSTGNHIVIKASENLIGETVEVIDLAGRVVKSERLNGDNEILIEKNGIYVVKINNEAWKVVIR